MARYRGVTGVIARENALRNPKRTATTSAALTIGVALIALTAVLASSAKASIAHTLSSSFTGDFVVDSGGMQAGGFPHQLADQLRSLPQVAAAVGIRGTTAELRGAGVAVVAGDPSQITRVADLGHIDGSLRDLGPGAIAVSEKAANKAGFHVGDTLAMTFPDRGSQRLRIAAIYANRDLLGDYGVNPDTYEGVSANRLDLKVMIKTRSGVSAQAARAAISAAAAAYPQAKVLDRSAFANSQTAMIDQMVNMIYPLLGLAIVIALIGIANTLALSILERTGELGLLRAVGMTRGQIRSAIRWEAAIVTLLGTLVGLVVGTAFGWGIVQALASQGITAFRVPVGQLAVMTAVAVIAGLAAATGPARRAARLNLLDAIAAV